MDAPRRPRKIRPDLDQSRRFQPMLLKGRVLAIGSQRVDEHCPVRYYPLFPLASRRTIPIRYC